LKDLHNCTLQCKQFDTYPNQATSEIVGFSRGDYSITIFTSFIQAQTQTHTQTTQKLHQKKLSLGTYLEIYYFTAPFNNMWTLKFKAQLTGAFFATVNQMFGGSSQLSITAKQMVIKSNH